MLPLLPGVDVYNWAAVNMLSVLTILSASLDSCNKDCLSGRRIKEYVAPPWKYVAANLEYLN